MPQRIYITSLQSPLGLLVIKGTTTAVRSVEFADTPLPIDARIPEILKQCIKELGEYFEGKRTEFTVPLEPEGTDFQENVWKALMEIGYASTKTYSTISLLLGDERKARAVGAASGANPIAILIPCHRLIGSDNSLTGYAGGLWRKQWLLEHEAHHGRGIRSLFPLNENGL